MPVPTMLAMTMQVAVRSEIFCALPTNVRDLTLGCRQLGRCRQRLGREEVANVSLINSTLGRDGGLRRGLSSARNSQQAACYSTTDRPANKVSSRRRRGFAAPDTFRIYRRDAAATFHESRPARDLSTSVAPGRLLPRARPGTRRVMIRSAPRSHAAHRPAQSQDRPG